MAGRTQPHGAPCPGRLQTKQGHGCGEALMLKKRIGSLLTSGSDLLLSSIARRRLTGQPLMTVVNVPPASWCLY